MTGSEPKFSELTDRLTSWATSHGAHIHPSVSIVATEKHGLSFQVGSSSTATQPGDTIISLPSSLTLSYLDALHGRTSFPEKFIAQTPPHVVGRFVLIEQYLIGEESFWAPYVGLLPQPDGLEWALPPFWPSDEVDLFEGTNVEVGIARIRDTAKREWENAMRILNEEDWNPSLRSRLDINLYHWAYCIFSSRSFRPSLVLSEESLPEGVRLDDFSILMPVFDIGNHDMTADVSWDLDLTRKCCDLKVDRAYGPGEQVFNNYSMKTNAELLLGYGFMLDEMEGLHNDYVHVRKRQAGPDAATEEYYISLRPVRHQSSLLARSKQTVQVSESTRVIGAFQHVQTDMVWDIFCTLAPADQHAHLVPAEDEQTRRDYLFSGRVSQDGMLYLQQTAAVIQHKVMQELERLEETSFEVVGGGGLTRGQGLALEYRARCRRVLENTLEAISTDETFGGEEKEEEEEEEEE